MYNLSQSIAGGFLTTTDYKSLNLANVATKEWKDQMIAGAVAAGQLTKVGDKYHIIGTKAGAASTAAELFNDDLKEGWASTEVLMKVLGDYGDTQTEIGKKAQASAQDVKSWGMMMETLSASVGTGWTDTFETIIGNITEAKQVFTPLSNTIGGLLDEMSKARNEPLKEWKNLGGRTILIEGMVAAFHALEDVIRPIQQAWKEIFPPVTGQTLLDLTKKFTAFTKSLQPTPEMVDAIKRTFKGVFAVLDIGWLVIQKIWGIFERLFKSMDGGGASLLQITARIGDFLVKVRDVLVNSQKFNDFFFKLGEAIKIPIKFITDLIGKIPQVMDQIPKLFDGMKNFKPDFGPFGVAIDNLIKGIAKLKPTGDGVKAVWEGLIKVFEKAVDVGKQMAGYFGKAFGGIGDGMVKATSGINFNQILGMLGVAGLGGIIVMIKRIKDTIKGAIENMGGGGGESLIDKIKDTFGGLTDTLSNMQQTLKASTLMLIAAAIALLTISVVQLSKVDAKKLPAVLAAITVMFTQLGAALVVLDKMTIGTSAVKMGILGGAMILLAIAIKILASAMEDMSKLSWDEILKGLVAVTGMLIGMSVAAKIMSGQNGNMIATGIGLIAVAVGVKILASAVKDFSEMDWQKMMQGLIGVGIVLGGLALFTRLAKVNKGAIGQAAGLILLGVALKIMASAVNDFANLNPATIQQGLGALTGVLMVLAGFTRLVDPKGMIGVAIAMGVLGFALKIMASAVQDFGNIPWDIMGRGLAGMAGALVAIAIAMRIMPKNILVNAASLVIVAYALGMLQEVLKKMGGMSWEEIGKGMVTLAGALVIMAGAMYLMSGGLAGAAALLIMCAALAVFVPILQTMGAMSWEAIWTGIGALALSLLTLGVAGAVLGVLSPLFAAFGLSLIIVGTGLVLVGAGLALFAIALTAAAVAGTAASTVLIAVVTALLGLIPFAFQQIGLGIVAFAKVLTDNVPVFIAAAVALIQGILTGIRIVVPDILNTIGFLINSILDFLVQNVPNFVQKGFDILIGFLQGIANNIGRVVTVAADIIVNFLNGLAREMPRIIEAGTNLVITFIRGIGESTARIAEAGADVVIKTVNSVADTIRNKSGELRAAGGNLASAIIDGMTGGLWSKAQSVAQAAWDLGAKAIAGIKNALDSNSPSKETYKLGTYAGWGLVDGMISWQSKVGRAATGVGETAVDNIRNSISGIGESLEDEAQFNPVIRPVLDLSDIQDKSGQIGNLLKVPTLNVDTAYAKAASLLERERANQSISSDGEVGTGSSGDTYLFTQTINSPKAVSQAEIYRNTNNLISMKKNTKKGAPTG
jgi:hypothetical protein